MRGKVYVLLLRWRLHRKHGHLLSGCRYHCRGTSTMIRVALLLCLLVLPSTARTNGHVGMRQFAVSAEIGSNDTNAAISTQSRREPVFIPRIYLVGLVNLLC
jgi:hypothetical protein